MPDTTPPSSEAADPSPYEEATRRSTSTSRYAAHGRGGAGNISAAPPPPVSPTDLETPTLKEEVYTTGRGGSGNMVANTGKAGARRAQDVVALPRRESEGAHVGRGGAANIVKVPTRGQGEESSVGAKDEREGKERKEVKEKKEGKGKGKNIEGAPVEEGVVERGRRWVAGLVRTGSENSSTKISSTVAPTSTKASSTVAQTSTKAFSTSTKQSNSTIVVSSSTNAPTSAGKISSTSTRPATPSNSTGAGTKLGANLAMVGAVIAFFAL